MEKYPKDLIQRITIYFKERYNHQIHEETAVEYLNSLAGLYESFIELLENDKPSEKK